MKSDHRHELKQNDLGALALKAGEGFERYGNQILLGLAAVLLVAGAVIWMVRNSRAQKEQGWTAFALANSAEEYANVADEYQGTKVGAWARLSAAEAHLQSGLQMAFTDRAASEDELKGAHEHIEKLLDDKSLSADLRERALIGMARYLEATSDGDTTKAVEAYRQFVKEFPGSIYKDLAQKQADALSSGSAQSFYAWFSKQTPKPEDRQLPRDSRGLLPPGHPPIDSSMDFNPFEPRGIDRWMFPETVPDLLNVIPDAGGGPALPEP